MVKKSAHKSPPRRPARAGTNSKTSERVQIGLKQKLIRRETAVIAGSLIGGLLIIAVIVSVFYRDYASPQRVFWDMIGNNLNTPGFTKHYISRSSEKLTDDIIQITFTPNIRAHRIKKFVSSTNEISLETVATPDQDYTRYTRLEQPTSPGQKNKDYSKVYNMWLIDGGNPQSGPQLINNALFRAVLFGDLNSAQKRAVFSQLKGIYQIDFTNIGRQTNSHRRTYTYQVTVPIKKYVEAAHTYAQLSGLSIANQLNPATYDARSQWRVKMTVDVLSRQLTKIEYLGQGVVENYSGYGIRPTINLPKNIVTAEKFNQALNMSQ